MRAFRHRMRGGLLVSRRECGHDYSDRYGGQMSATKEPTQQKILAALLEWSCAMGADAAVGEHAVDWLAEGRGPPGSDFNWSAEDAAPGQSPSTPPRPQSSVQGGLETKPRGAAQPASAPRKFATAAPDVAVGEARRSARTATDLAALRSALETFEGCSLKATAKSLCFYRGADTAPLMIIGEAPGRDEDIEGRPFVGRAGQLLDLMLAAGGWSESDVHITNIVYWRPPGNRTPTPQETEVCRPFLERQIELVGPKVLLLLGGAAAKQIFRTDEGILKIRGRWQTLQFGGVNVATLASLHPAYLLRTPIAKRQAWRDLLSVKEMLAAPA